MRGGEILWAASAIMTALILAAQYSNDVTGSDVVYFDRSPLEIAILLAPSLLLLVIMRAPHWLKLLSLVLLFATALLLACATWCILQCELGWLFWS